MINKKLHKLIIQRKNSTFLDLLEIELKEYILDWEIMDLTLEEGVEPNTCSIYIWLNEQYARKQEREVTIDFERDNKVTISFRDDNRTDNHVFNNVSEEILGTVEFLASTARWLRDLIEPKILYTVEEKGIHTKTI